MTATDPFGAPVSEFVKLDDVLGRLVLITPSTITKGIASTLKGQEGKTYDAVRALVVVLDGSRVAQVGSHDDLMAKGGPYAELYAIQAAAYR